MAIMFNTTTTNPSKRAAVISIITLFTRTGATLQQIMDEYRQMVNQDLAPTTAACEAFIRSMDDVVCIDGLYFSTSPKSEHIRRLIRNQNSPRQQIGLVPRRLPIFIPPDWRRF